MDGIEKEGHVATDPNNKDVRKGDTRNRITNSRGVASTEEEHMVVSWLMVEISDEIGVAPVWLSLTSLLLVMSFSPMMPLVEHLSSSFISKPGHTLFDQLYGMLSLVEPYQVVLSMALL
ncbi:hypothetical protein VNO78_05455 [Psophocarpus tetragonolobus]|uniref:Uncharacterized protein n=1 Tax=Psophocarpus tetragonolobus TaxID=3891 RepID=A0AAN9SQV0_PSOTE